jgi:hydrogenase maturation factor
MSLASGLGFVLREAEVPVAPETERVCAKLSIDPLKLIGSGALLLAVENGKERVVRTALESICGTAVVGRFSATGRVLIRKDGRKQGLRSAPEDELWRVLGRTGLGRH